MADTSKSCFLFKGDKDVGRDGDVVSGRDVGLAREAVITGESHLLGGPAKYNRKLVILLTK